MTTPPPPENSTVTFRRIRKAIGVLAFGLPVVLLLLSAIPFFDTDLQPSISHYYYTNLRELFIGVLCAVGLFLIRYHGHQNPNIWKNDSLLTNLAGYMAFGVAFLPTNPDDCSDKIYTLLPLCHDWIGWLHYAFAGAFFAILSIIAINVFTIGQEADPGIPEGVFDENHIYKACGFAMVVFMIMIPLFAWLKVFPYSTTLFEALALFAFGIAWLIKGRALGDKGAIGRAIYREDNK